MPLYLARETSSPAQSLLCFLVRDNAAFFGIFHAALNFFEHVEFVDNVLEGDIIIEALDKLECGLLSGG